MRIYFAVDILLIRNPFLLLKLLDYHYLSLEGHNASSSPAHIRMIGQQEKENNEKKEITIFKTKINKILL